MSTVSLPASPVVVSRSPDPVPARSPWLVGRWFDLFLFANVAWPIVALAAALGIQAVTQTLTFWQVYLLATPHRWITLSLVFLDRERFDQRRLAYLSILLFFLIVVVAAMRVEAVALLVAIDFLWNAWHFAAQHSGIARIYNRVARPEDQGNGMLEKVLLRTFLVYVILRLVGHPLMGLDRQRWLGWLDEVIPYAKVLDFPMLALPAFLLLREMYAYTPAALGRLVYLSSVCLLYGSVLVGLYFDEPGTHFSAFHAGMLVGISVFHSVEYLAIVSWSVKKRHARSTRGVFGHLVPRWGLALAAFMVVMAGAGWLLDAHYRQAWVILTLLVSYLHYAYDGMIWKVRRPASAAVA